MKSFLIILSVIFLITPLFAAEKSSKVKNQNAKTQGNIKLVENYVAIFDLETQGKIDKGVIRSLSESIMLEIRKAGRYEIIDRGNMNKILGEQKFQLSGCVGECRVEAGQLLGVGKIVTGTLNLIGKTYHLTLSLINVETGKVEFSEDESCKCEIDDLIESSKRLAKKLMGEIVEGSSTDAKPEKLNIDTIPDIEMVFVRGGCFQMGNTFGDEDSDEKPVHEVCVDDFYIGKYEVTQGQWRAIMGNNPSYFKNCGDNCPVEQVSWSDVKDFINKLNQKTGQSYKLPTEAEWEYAARSGGKKEKYAGTSSESELIDYAWYDKNSGGKTHPVGQKKPNGIGRYDMSGNVWEWVADWYGSDYYKNSPKNNPTGPTNNVEYGVLRGGSWYSTAGDMGASYRLRSKHTDRFPHGGFRLSSK